MKVTINIDNDVILAYTALMGIKGEDKEKVKTFLAENESVEVEPLIWETMKPSKA